MTKPDISKKDQIKAGIVALVIEGMEEGTVPFDVKFIAEQTEWLATIEANFNVPQPTSQVDHARELLAYIDTIAE